METARQTAPGSILVSGGLGDIGQLAGCWIATSHPHVHVWLLGRSGRFTHPMAAMLSSHASCITMSASDIAVTADMAGLMQGLAASGSQMVTGILHAGAVLHDTLLSRQTAQSLRIVFAPKASGALCLLRVASGMPLDRVVQFSSLTAQLGTPGQSNYAAGNGALEGIAQDHVNSGIQNSSIMWGPWATGMAGNNPRILERFRKSGLGVITGTHMSLMHKKLVAEQLHTLLIAQVRAHRT